MVRIHFSPQYMTVLYGGGETITSKSGRCMLVPQRGEIWVRILLQSRFYMGVAQLVERVFWEHQAGGSWPSTHTKIIGQDGKWVKSQVCKTFAVGYVRSNRTLITHAVVSLLASTKLTNTRKERYATKQQDVVS